MIEPSAKTPLLEYAGAGDADFDDCLVNTAAIITSATSAHAISGMPAAQRFVMHYKGVVFFAFEGVSFRVASA